MCYGYKYKIGEVRHCGKPTPGRKMFTPVLTQMLSERQVIYRKTKKVKTKNRILDCVFFHLNSRELMFGKLMFLEP